MDISGKLQKLKNNRKSSKAKTLEKKKNSYYPAMKLALT
mgnify:CR=1 FL=1|jgi:hypothetical protein